MRSKHGIMLFQQKYMLEFLCETGKLGAKPFRTLMAPNVSELFEDLDGQKRLVAELIIL